MGTCEGRVGCCVWLALYSICAEMAAIELYTPPGSWDGFRNNLCAWWAGCNNVKRCDTSLLLLLANVPYTDVYSLSNVAAGLIKLIDYIAYIQNRNIMPIDEFQIDPVCTPHWNRGSLCQVTTPMRGRLMLISSSACVNTESLVIKPGSAQTNVNFVILGFVYKSCDKVSFTNILRNKNTYCWV